MMDENGMLMEMTATVSPYYKVQCLHRMLSGISILQRFSKIKRGGGVFKGLGQEQNLTLVLELGVAN